jgi:hypothetical protein
VSQFLAFSVKNLLEQIKTAIPPVPHCSDFHLGHLRPELCQLLALTGKLGGSLEISTRRIVFFN